MPPVRFEPTISPGERPQTYALDRAATGTGKFNTLLNKKKVNYVKIQKWCTLTILHLAAGAPGLEVLSRFQADNLLCNMVDCLGLTLLGYHRDGCKEYLEPLHTSPFSPAQVRAVMTAWFRFSLLQSAVQTPIMPTHFCRSANVFAS